MARTTSTVERYRQDLLDAAKCSNFTMNETEIDILVAQITLFQKELVSIDVALQMGKSNTIPYFKHWQKTKLRPDIVHPVDNDVLYSNCIMQDGSFVVKGNLYGDEL